MSPRWIAIRASAAISILGSLTILLLAGLMLAFVMFAPPVPNAPAQPIPVKPLTIGMANVFILLAAWGIATAAGIFRRRRWARISILVFAAILTFVSVGATLMIFVIPMPETPGAPSGLTSVIRGVIGSFYGVLATIGIWWLILFNLSRSQPYFAEPEPGRESSRPLSISVIAWYLLSGVLFCVPMAIFRAPAMLFGILFTGWTALTIYVALAATHAYLGIGLLRLRESARVASLVYFCVVTVSGLPAMLPSRQRELVMQMKASWPWMNQPGQEVFLPQAHWPFVLIMLAVMGVPVFFLLRRRSAFQPHPEPPNPSGPVAANPVQIEHDSTELGN
ncbi:hypothetical protein [uncultured Paludibaculum sp.]|uniref:hypothetical protein n=1 Tax=uncultured Paludibaculum sp. TaxID=1765020 RepID=UPI002AAAF772|nr:hypothetical protein [uncultured Paludibaculum sp.]